MTGVWWHRSYTGFGTPEREPFHVSWEFLDGDRVRIVTPRYKAQPEGVMDRDIKFWPDRRFQVYNTVGGERINLFSGRWALAGDNLVWKFNTGDQFPDEAAEPKAIEAVLTLARGTAAGSPPADPLPELAARFVGRWTVLTPKGGTEFLPEPERRTRGGPGTRSGRLGR